MSAFDVAAAVTTFVLILPAELPDKTFVATLVLSTRLRPLPVWIGVIAAFFVQCLVAVVAGGLLSLLPNRLVAGVAAVLFAIGSFVLIRGGMVSRAQEQADEAEEEAVIEERLANAQNVSAVRSAAIAFGVLFAAEWGDLSQLLTAAQAARTGSPFAVFVGAWLALVLVSGVAVVMGRWLQKRVPLARIRFVGGGLLAILAVIATIECIRG